MRASVGIVAAMHRKLSTSFSVAMGTACPVTYARTERAASSASEAAPSPILGRAAKRPLAACATRGAPARTRRGANRAGLKSIPKSGRLGPTASRLARRLIPPAARANRRRPTGLANSSSTATPRVMTYAGPRSRGRAKNTRSGQSKGEPRARASVLGWVSKIQAASRGDRLGPPSRNQRNAPASPKSPSATASSDRSGKRLEQPLQGELIEQIARAADEEPSSGVTE